MSDTQKYPKAIRPLLCHQRRTQHTHTNDDRAIDSARVFVFSILFGIFFSMLNTRVVLLLGAHRRCSCCCWLLFYFICALNVDVDGGWWICIKPKLVI